MSTYLQSSMLTLLGMPADVRAGLSAEQAGVAAEYLRLMHPVTRRTAGIFNERRHLTILDRDVFRRPPSGPPPRGDPGTHGAVRR